MSNASMSARDTRHVFGSDSEPTEMEMRVAKAICREVCEDHLASGFAGPQDFQNGLDADWREYLPTARAAIRAMREPTFRMIDEGATSSDEICMYPENVWRAMIDAASPQEE